MIGAGKVAALRPRHVHPATQLMLRCRATEHTLRKALSVLFYILNVCSKKIPIGLCCYD